jgi:lincosamide and streptogramin A transport system ATP-binding/permease protein
MSMIDVSNLSFTYEGSYDSVFEDVSFRIDTDWRLGFTGRNGKGKTTFLKLLMGQYHYSGTISANVEFEYFPYEVEDRDRITLEVVEEILHDYQSWELMRELHLLEVSEDVLTRRFSTLSNGEQTKLLLAALFLRENSFLLIDEPTNHLDIAGRKIVSRYLNSKHGFILVSHDRAFLDSCVDHIMSINKTDIEIQKGNFSSWWENKEKRDSFELAENEKLKRDITRLETSAKRSADWSEKIEATKYGTKNSGLRPDRGYIGHKAEKMMKRSKAIESRQTNELEEKAKLLKNLEDSDKLKLMPLRYHSERLLALQGVSVYYNGSKVCGDVSFEIIRGDRVALRGKNGSGKSSILKLLYGQEINYSGNLWIGSGIKISYISQDTSQLCGSLSDYAEENGIDKSVFKAMLRKLDFSRVQFEKDMSEFSGGQKKKVLIARSLCESAHLYVWDEPLNFVDVLSRMQIEKLLMEYKPTIIFVEHDSAFCENIATKTVEL